MNLRQAIEQYGHQRARVSFLEGMLAAEADGGGEAADDLERDIRKAQKRLAAARRRLCRLIGVDELAEGLAVKTARRKGGAR